jgi:hypothetical protein
MKIVAIDPGKKGALAVIDAKTFEILSAYPFQLVGNEIDFRIIIDIIESLRNENKSTRFFLENLSINALFGKSTIASQAETVGRLRGILDALKVSYAMVPPKTWQKLVHGPGKEKIKAKAKSFEAIQRLYPNQKWNAKDDGIIDAVLIGYYGAMKMGGMNG